jgi:hypothetical protein
VIIRPSRTRRGSSPLDRTTTRSTASVQSGRAGHPAVARTDARGAHPAGADHRRAAVAALPLSHVRIVVPGPGTAGHGSPRVDPRIGRPDAPAPATHAVVPSAPASVAAGGSTALADESGSLVTEYGLVAVLGATIAGIAIKWASGGAIFELLGALMQQVRVLVGV